MFVSGSLADSAVNSGIMTTNNQPDVLLVKYRLTRECFHSYWRNAYIRFNKIYRSANDLIQRMGFLKAKDRQKSQNTNVTDWLSGCNILQ